MPAEVLSSVPQLAGIVEKLGVIGVLLIAVCWLIWERLRLIKQSVKTFRQRDKARLIAERYKSALLGHSIALPDIRDVDDLFKEDDE